MTIDVRSYRSVFELERRIYRVDSVRLNPGGVPLRGIVYLLVCVCCCLLTGALPGVRVLAGWVPWYLRDVLAPAAAAAALTTARVDGRACHHVLVAIVGLHLRPRQLSAFSACTQIGHRWRHGPIVLVPDGSDARLRRLRYRGPGVVVLTCTHRRMEWTRRVVPWRSADVTVSSAAQHGTLTRPVALELAAGALLEVRS